MTLLPIAERELRVRARRGATYTSRVLAVLLASLVGGFVYALVFVMGANAPGKTFFTILSIVAFLFCLFEGLHQTVDSVSGEKREGTLGLLFLTDLSGYDIVLGKLTAASVNVSFGLVGMAPILGLSLLMGGVTLEQFARMMLALLNTLFFALCLGLRASASARDQGKAWGVAIGVLAIMALILPPFGTISMVLAANVPGGAIVHFILVTLGTVLLGVSPVGAFSTALSVSRSGGPSFWGCLAVAHLVSWFFLYRASRRLPHSWQDNPSVALPVYQPATAPSSAQAPLEPSIESGSRTTGQKLRHQLLAINPVTWLALRRSHSARPVWMLAGMGMLWAVMMIPDQDFRETGLFLMSVTKLALRIWVAVFAGGFFAKARKDGALELLMSTPMTSQQIIRGQWLALRKLFLGPTLVLCGVDLLCWVLIYGDIYGRTLLMAGWPGSIAFPLQLAALASLSMWLALRLHRPTRAAVLSLIIGFVLPQFCLFPGAIVAHVFLLVWSQYRLHRALRALAVRV